MLQNIRQISLLNKIFNVRGNEWPRIGLTWIITFLYRVGFVIGWTVLVALFVSNYGIASLPYLFVMNAGFSILGSLLYSTFLDKLSKDYLMVGTVFLACAVLFSAFCFASSNQILFFALLIVAEAIFLVQFRIILHGFTEEMFTPIQSERTFPLIESSETVGGIIAGLIVTFVAGVIDPASFVLIWIGTLLLMVPFIFFCKFINKKVKLLKSKKKKEKVYNGFFTRLRNEFKNTNHISYIKGLFLIVFFQWFLFNLLEFQYTKAVYQNVSNMILDAGGGFEHAFVHDLGQLFILFSSAALIVQLFVGSRLINSLGVIGSMLLHPIVTLLSMVGLATSFNFRNAVLAKTNFTITTVIHTNAYHSSYYAVSENLREHIREFLDGIVRPVGAIFGTLVLIVLQKYLVGESLVFYVNLSMIVVCLLLFYVTYAQQHKYTRVALDDLQNSKNKEIRFDAIDILTQKGHKYPLSVLTCILHDKNEPTSIRVKILRAFAEIQDIAVIKDVVKCLGAKTVPMRMSAIDALLAYKVLYKDSKKYLVVEHELIDSLKKAYRCEKNEEIRSKILTLLSRISTVATFDFLMHVLKRARGKLKADIIYALGNYKDSSVVGIIRPYLSSKDRKYRVSAVISLGRFKEFRQEAFGIISSLVNSKDPKEVIDGIYAAGELNFRQKKNVCLHYLNSKDDVLKLNSAIALAKMGHEESIPVLIDLLFHGKKDVALETKKLLSNVDVRIYKNLDRIVRHLVVQEVEKLIPKEEVTFKNLSKKDLKTLKWLYSLIEEYDEIESINSFLKI